MESNAADHPLRKRAEEGAVPLTALQQRLLTALTRSGQAGLMRIADVSVRICGPLSLQTLQRCLERVIQRHESLRTRIATVDGISLQHVAAEGACTLDIVDLSGIPSGDRSAAVDVQVRKFMQEKTDLSADPIFSTKLLKLCELEHVLLFGVDHLVCDGVSAGILSTEIWTAYDQLEKAGACTLKEIPIQFPDYSLWQARNQEAWRRKHALYWKARLGDAPANALSARNELSVPKYSTLTRAMLSIGEEPGARLRAVCGREGIPLSLAVLAVLVAAAARWRNQNDLIVGVISHGRSLRPRLAGTTGFLACMAYLRIGVSAADTFFDLTRRLSEELLEAARHSPFDHVPDVVPGITPTLSFNWTVNEWTPPRTRRLGRNEEIEVHPFPIRADKGERAAPLRYLSFDVWPEGLDAGDDIIVGLWNSAEVLSPGAIEELGRQVQLVAAEFAGQPRAPLPRNL